MSNKPMTITYVANIRMPTERAHGLQIVKTCEAFIRAGVLIRLVVPRRKTSISESPEDYYRLTAPLPIVYVPVFDTVSWGRLGFLLESFFFALGARRHISGLVYSRDEWALALLMMLGARAVWESHTGAWNIAARYVARRAKVIVISEGLRQAYIERGIDPARILVAHDGVDVAAFAAHQSKAQARRRLGLPEGSVALYVGSFGGWKGTNTLFEAAALLPPEVRVVVIGGTAQEVADAKKRHPQVLYLGPRPYAELPDNLAAADMLVLPNTATSDVSLRFTSPLKLFAYMASGVPIVASDLPSIREVLDESTAYFARPDDPASFAATIVRAASDTQATKRAHKAALLAQQYGWDARVRAILSFISE